MCFPAAKAKECDFDTSLQYFAQNNIVRNTAKSVTLTPRCSISHNIILFFKPKSVTLTPRCSISHNIILFFMYFASNRVWLWHLVAVFRTILFCFLCILLPIDTKKVIENDCQVRRWYFPSGTSLDPFKQNHSHRSGWYKLYNIWHMYLGSTTKQVNGWRRNTNWTHMRFKNSGTRVITKSGSSSSCVHSSCTEPKPKPTKKTIKSNRIESRIQTQRAKATLTLSQNSRKVLKWLADEFALKWMAAAAASTELSVSDRRMDVGR